jgi:hypothetical protein
VLSEHLLPLAAGFAAGVAASVLAVYPAASLSGAGLPIGQMLLLLGTMAGCALASVAAASVVSLRQPLLAALRNE